MAHDSTTLSQPAVEALSLRLDVKSIRPQINPRLGQVCGLSLVSRGLAGLSLADLSPAGRGPAGLGLAGLGPGLGLAGLGLADLGLVALTRSVRPQVMPKASVCGMQQL